MINLYNGDCMEIMAKMPDKFYDLAIVDLKQVDNFCNSRNVFKIAFPKPNYLNSHFSHIGILRYVKSHTLNLSMVGIWINIFLAMPIIAIKLYNDIFRWDESINSKLSTNNILTNKINAAGCKDGISKQLFGSFLLFWSAPILIVCALKSSLSFLQFMEQYF